MSWSGKKSWHLAHRMAEWMPAIVPNIEFFLSSEIPAGARWLDHLKEGLSGASMAILCITSENMNSQWLNFEAGAMWNRFDQDIPVCPLLFGVAPEELTGPLNQFQSKSFTERDVKSLAELIAKKSNFTGDRSDRVKINFEITWSRLERDVLQDTGNIPDSPGGQTKNDPPEAINRFESARDQILSYLNKHRFNAVRFTRIREKIDDSWDDKFLLAVISKYHQIFRRANFNDGAKGIGRAVL